MKLQRTPLILLAIALLLGGFVYVREIQGASQQKEAEAKTEKLFSFNESEVQTLNLTTPTQTLAFTKTSAPVPNSKQKQQSSPSPTAATWMMTSPEKAPASDASVAYLLNLMATGQRQQALTIPVAKQAEFGFDNPTAIAEVKLNNQQTHRLILGKPNFNRSAIYAQVDPPANSNSDLSIALVPIDFENAVQRPLTEWKSKETGTNEKNQPDKPASSVKSSEKPNK